MVNSKNTKKITIQGSGATDYIVSAISHIIVIGFAILCIFPFLYVISMSFTSYTDYIKDPLRFLPGKFDLAAYKRILSFRLIYTGYKSTLFVTGIGTLVNIILLLISAYPLTKKSLKGRNIVLGMIVFTMFFSGGMIPSFILVRQLGLINSLWALILPGAISSFNLILMKNFMQASIPEALEEASIIDGANELQILWHVVIPLSLPAIATFTVFCSVGHWNNFFSAVLYISRRELWPLMLVLRELVIEDIQGMLGNAATIAQQEVRANPFTMKMATIVITTLPILIIYPFMQKYFVTGLFIGSVKE